MPREKELEPEVQINLILLKSLEFTLATILERIMEFDIATLKQIFLEVEFVRFTDDVKRIQMNTEYVRHEVEKQNGIT